MSKDISREWLKINRICKEVRWLTYDPDYNDIDLGTALKILEQLKDKVAEDMEKP